jgi:glycosyltransferase involved in cell wall biosynthesis
MDILSGSPQVGVIIPAYNNAVYLREAIQSVLNQTYANWQVIVVDDGSPDHPRDVVQEFWDPRIKYIAHDANRGLAAARNTGICASTGEIIALLDGDDLYHPDKLATHVQFLQQHPEIGVTFNSRFELNHSARTIRELWRPPPVATLSDLLLGFPFSPSDMVLRREWLFRVDLFDEAYRFFGEDLDINCRLALAGCQFANVGRALNYRRYHSGREIEDIRTAQEIEMRPLYAAFSDPRCPASATALQDLALSNRLLGWSFVAFDQGETELGQAYCRDAVRLNPSLLQGEPCPLLLSLLSECIVDESRDHEQVWDRIAAQFPPELAFLKRSRPWAVATGFLKRGARATIWDRPEDGRVHFDQAAQRNASLDESFLGELTQQLLDYEAEFGIEAAQRALQGLVPHLRRIGGRSSVRWLNGCLSINRAFLHYRSGRYRQVPGMALRAIANDPGYAVNRGLLSILVRSSVGMPFSFPGLLNLGNGTKPPRPKP